MWQKDLKKIYVDTKHPVAIDSPDHQMPWGTIKNSSTNRFFNEKLNHLFKDKFLQILDLGCSGGGFVKSCLDEGHLAIGLEGSDLSKKTKRSHWANLSDLFLFTADITKPFSIKSKTKNSINKLLFDIITLWEVIEHINEQDLTAVCNNLKNHLLPSGLIIMSVNPNEEIINGVKLHQTVKEKKWWIDFFAAQNLKLK